MKKYLLFTMVAVLLLTVVSLYGCQQASPGEASNNQQMGIWVTGTGEVNAAPDAAILQLGIQAQALTVDGAQSQASSAMNDVMSALTSNGVAEKDIQTQYYSIQQVTKWDNTKQESVVVGYQVANMLTVKVRNLTKTGTIIDAVVVAGGDLIRINNIQFTIDNPTDYYDQAREKAMADAKDTATQLAELSNIKLDKPIYISETDGSVSQPTVVRTLSAADSSASTPISTGELKISLTVQINYAIQ